MSPAPPPLKIGALHASHAGIWLAEADGTVRPVSKGEAIGRAAETPLVMLNAPLVAQRLGYAELSGLDLLELFAFIHPARFAVPTPKGLAKALGLFIPDDGVPDADAPRLYLAAAAKMLSTLEADWPEREGAWDAAQALYRLRWPWAGFVRDRMKKPEKAERWLFSRLPEWEEAGQRGAPLPVSVQEGDALTRLDALTGQGREKRQGQRDFTAAATHAFAPRHARGQPNMLLAEAGTGIGKTLGYLAPASLWAEKADGGVWVSTYTKALQRQLVAEAQRVYRDPATFRSKVVVRKGREKYRCLLNLEDALQGGFAGRAAVLAQLVARWAAYSRDGDMIGGDLPGWLTTLFRRNGTTALTDRRGECVYAGCPHYRKCFIERAVRASADADLVIANHALVMVNAARGREQGARPTRFVFDEGHHLFDAADSMFGAALTGGEMIELRRWIAGPEGKSRGRRRGLAARLSDIASYDEEGGRAISAALDAAQTLPGEGWLARVGEGDPFGPMERMLSAVRALTYARDEQGADAGYGLEAVLTDLDGPLTDALADAAQAIEALHRPMVVLAKRLEALSAEPPDWLDAQGRARIEGAIVSLGWRAEMLAGWLALLARASGPSDPDFVDWMIVERGEGREFDVGIRRHWLDPMRPVADLVLKPAHGVLVTSATLRDGHGTDDTDWALADWRSGANHLEGGVRHFLAQSPFDYARQAEVLIVTDIQRGDMAALAAAYGRLIEASRGGVLGLFTAIRRLRAVHARIADRLARSGLPLLAQHIDPIDTGTLVDIFRDDPHSSLLGTDALRDGVDVPGDSLRLVVMEGVPWPKPTILHKVRRAAFAPLFPNEDGGSRGGTGMNGYDDFIIRSRMAQAFGRLIRHGNDTGRFVLLSAAVPSRLLSAFPAGTPIRRVTLDGAVMDVASSLSAVTKTGQRGNESIAPFIGDSGPQL